MMVQCSHTDDDRWMIKKYDQVLTYEDGAEDEAMDDDDPEDVSTFIC